MRFNRHFLCAVSRSAVGQVERRICMKLALKRMTRARNQRRMLCLDMMLISRESDIRMRDIYHCYSIMHRSQRLTHRSYMLQDDFSLLAQAGW